jgi:hypothetical protein
MLYKKDASGPEGPSVGSLLRYLDGQAKACPYLISLLRRGAPVGAEKQIPFGNDRQKSKSKGKSNRRSFGCATLRSG